MKYRVSLSLGLIGILAACATRPAPPPSPPRTTNLDLEITNFELSNGLRVVHVRDPRAKEIHVTMRYAVGGVDEPTGQEGIAHLVEHLMFQQVVGAQSIFAKLESTAREFNAFTSFDATTYTTRAPADRLGALLSIEAVRLNLRCTSVTEAAFTREREVVANELRMRDQSTELLSAFDRGVFPDGHPYAKLLGGTTQTVGAITMQQACAFADAHYGPSNAVLVVSGNVETTELQAAVGKFLQHVPARSVTAARRIDAPGVARAVETNAPIDDDAILVAWPLPSQPDLRVRALAVGTAISAAIDASVQGRVLPIMLGDSQAEQFGLVITREGSETTTEILEAVKTATADAPLMFSIHNVLDMIVFNRVQQSAIYRSFAELEEGSDRDTRLATHVLAGRKPQAALGAELQGLRGLIPADGVAIARQLFSYGRANIVVLKASESTRGSTKLEMSAPIHDIGQRRDPPDPAEALQPATEPLATREPQGMVTRTLPNGMRVILVPLTSVPVIDVRIVFGAGTADEVESRRGAAIVAGKGLGFDMHHINDVLNMAAAGGSVEVDVDEDRIVFSTRGLDMHVDYLLAGLRRLVRDGEYKRDAGTIVQSLRGARKATDDEGALTDAWRVALYGAQHPYVKAGIMRHTSPKLDLDDVERFRAAHFTPDNATVIIAGRFDAALADRWIEYLFADWQGKAAQRTVAPAATQATSLAKDDAISQIQLRIALPAPSGTRAERMIAAAMLSDIVADVRHQLGAAYSLGASFAESRQAMMYLVAGGIDAPRTRAALELIKARVAQLRADPDAAARAFVAARRHVLSTLTTTTGSAAVLGERVTTDVTLARAPLSDVALASEIHSLTIARMTAALADFDLSRAAILMRGPHADVDAAFAVLGRTPTRISTEGTDDESPFEDESDVKMPDEGVVMYSDIEPALTQQRDPTPFSVAILAGYASGKVRQKPITGTAFSLAGSRRFDLASIGVRLGLASLVNNLDSVGAVPVSASIYAHTTAYNRLWLGASLGLDFTRITQAPMEPVWRTGLNIGLDAGVDLLRFSKHRLTVFARVETELSSIAAYTAYSFGGGYRWY